MARKARAAVVAASDGGVLVAVHVKPGASNSAVGHLDPWRGRLEVEVKSRAEHGRANAELCELLAAALGLRAGQVTLVKGHRSREKTVRIEGLAAPAVRTALEERR